MELHGWITLLMVGVLVAILVRDLLAPAAAVMLVLVALLVLGVVSPEQAFAGFANPAPITVAALYVVARGVEKTGALQPVVHATLGDEGGRRSLLRLLAPTAAASSVLNNTPIVAIIAPQVAEWAARRKLSPSLYLMPLSFAAIVGGLITVIGTSTNLVVSGLLVSAEMEAIGMFEMAWIGLPIAVVAVPAIVLVAPIVLSPRVAARQHLSESVREFVVDMQVIPEGPLDGRTVQAAGLRQLQGVFLIQIERAGQTLAPVAPETQLLGGDRLRFVGRADLVVDLQRTRGLVTAERGHLPHFDPVRSSFFEVVIGEDSPLVNKTLREASFRNEYNAGVLAIHRSGRRIEAKLGAVRLRVGDTLLIISDPAFRDRWYDRRDFLLVSRVGGRVPVSTRQAWTVAAIGVGIVFGAGTGVLPILEGSLVGAALLVLLGVLRPSEARRAIDIDVIVLIAASFGVGAAIQQSGLAEALASILISATGGLGPVAVLLGVVLATIVLTEVITNNAAAVLVFPIAMATAAATGIDPRPLAIAIAVGASASFLTPIGYQTNTMVYGPGGYRFTDYSRLGIPLTLLVIVMILLIVPTVWPL